MEPESITETPKFAVGDELAFSYGWGKGRWAIHKITKITPSGRIKCGPYELDPNLRVRGRRDAYSAAPYKDEVVTDKIRKEVREAIALSLVANFKWHTLPIEKLLRIVEILNEKDQETS